MITCDQLATEVDALVALPASDERRRDLTAHTAICARCDAAVRRAERLHALLGEVPQAPVPSPAAFEAMAKRVLARETRWKPRWTVAMAALCGGLAVLSMSSHVAAPGTLVFAVLGVVVAGACALLGSPSYAALAAIGLSLGATLLNGAGADVVDAGLGSHCAAAELLAAAFPLLALAWVVNRDRTLNAARQLGAAAAIGALAGQAALLAACPESHNLSHLMTFHTGTVAVAWALGLFVGRIQQWTASFRL